MTRDDMRALIRQGCYVLITILIIWGHTAIAAVAHPVVQAQSEVVDLSFWFRTLLTVLMGVLIWVAKGSDTRLKYVEGKIQEFDSLRLERGTRIINLESHQSFLDGRIDNIAGQIISHRELLLTGYHNKEDFEAHRRHVELSLKHISDRVDVLTRPHTQRATDL